MRLLSLRSLLVAAALWPLAGPAQDRPIAPPQAFPALGLPANPRVEIPWNRFYNVEALNLWLRKLAEAHPELAQLVLVGKSYEGRDIWALEITNRRTGDAHSKPAMYIDGNIHGNEVQAGETVLYTAWYLLENHGRVERITKLLDERAFYLLPSINPDGRDHWLQDANDPNMNRGGRIPVDNDGDGLFDEDGPDDLDGDGNITQMRIRDPRGRWKADPKFPDLLMVEAEPGEFGDFTLLDDEGIDNDGDGRVNEDGPGGYDPNRNWGFDWAPEGVQYGAHVYPFSLPETRAVADYVLARPNIAAVQSYHNAGGMILRGPGREGGEFSPADNDVLRRIGERGAAMLPYYRNWVVYADLYTVWGGEIDWFYGSLGIGAFTNELWSEKNLYRRDLAPGEEGERDRIRFLRDLLQGQGIVPWTEVDHPTYGKVEVGGTAKTFGRTPPAFLLEEEMHRNAAFTLFHAESMPLLRIADITVEPLEGGLSRVRVAIDNEGLLPTRLDHDVKNAITRKNSVTLSGAGLRVVASGLVTDRHFGTVEWQEKRPERLLVETVRGRDRVLAEFLVEGRGEAAVEADALRGGRRTQTVRIP